MSLPKTLPERPVFEASVGLKKYLCDANAQSLKFLIEITGKSPQQQATLNNMYIVPRYTINKKIVKTLRKLWYSEMVDWVRARNAERNEKRRAKRAKLKSKGKRK